MDPEKIFEIVVVIISVPIALLIIYAGVIGIKKDIRYRKNLKQELENPVVYPDIKTIKARVIAKNCDILKFSSKTKSDHKVVYWAEFLTDNNENVRYEIPQTLYDKLNKFDTGILATCDNGFFAFEKD